MSKSVQIARFYQNICGLAISYTVKNINASIKSVEDIPCIFVLSFKINSVRKIILQWKN